MSEPAVGAFPARTSGARYMSVPVNDGLGGFNVWVKPRFVMPSALSLAGSMSEALPKSATRTRIPSVIVSRMLAGFKSLCSTPASCASATALATFAKTRRRISKGTAPMASGQKQLRSTPAYSLSMKYGALSKFHSSSRTKSERSPRVSLRNRATVTSRCRLLMRDQSQANLKTRSSCVFGCSASHTS